MRGINLIGHLQSPLGLGEKALLIQEALQLSAIPYAPYPYPDPDNSPEKDKPTPKYDTSLFCLEGDEMRPAARALDPRFFQARYNIGLWTWDTAALPEHLLAGASYLDEIWTFSDFARQAIAKTTDIPVRTIPLPALVPEPAGTIILRELSESKERSLKRNPYFLATCDLLTGIETKNPQATIQAFLEAFPAPDDAPLLLIKTTHGQERPLDLLYLEKLAARHPNIRVVDRPLTDGQLAKLLQQAQCYLSLHRSTAIGQTLLWAMALGTPCLATGHSGNLEFMAPTNSYLCPHHLVEIGKDSFPYPAGTPWAEPDLHQAAELMREIHQDPTAAAARGKVGQKDVLDRFSPQATADAISSHLQSIGDSPSRVEAVSLQLTGHVTDAYHLLKKDLHQDKLQAFRPRGLLRLCFGQILDLFGRYDRHQRQSHSTTLKALKENESKQRREIRRLEGQVAHLTQLLHRLLQEPAPEDDNQPGAD